MNIKQLLIRLNKVGIENREKALTLIVEGKEVDFNMTQMIIRQDDIAIDTAQPEEAPVVKKKEVKEEVKVEEEVPVIKAADLKEAPPEAPKKTRKRKTKKED